MAIEKVTSQAAYQASSVQQTAKAVESVTPVSNTQRQVVSGASDISKEGTEKREASNENIKKAVSDLNKKMSNTTAQFGIHEGTNRVTVKIVDKETKDVLKEFPAEETLEMIAKVWELAGIMVDKKL
ncbi:MAG: flagellar protein FlaG [Lachnospiraceae bacterium]|nr:flagellar protein FlaG [Lachnospiraceae bacterium]